MKLKKLSALSSNQLKQLSANESDSPLSDLQLLIELHQKLNNR